MQATCRDYEASTQVDCSYSSALKGAEHQGVGQGRAGQGRTG